MLIFLQFQKYFRHTLFHLLFKKVRLVMYILLSHFQLSEIILGEKWFTKVYKAGKEPRIKQEFLLLSFRYFLLTF